MVSIFHLLIVSVYLYDIYIMSIVTKTGDGGTTGRFGGGRIPKADPRICAIGSVDELNSAIGLLCARQDLPLEVSQDLKTIQSACFTIGSQLSTPQDAPQEAKDYIPRITEDDVLFLDRKNTISSFFFHN